MHNFNYSRAENYEQAASLLEDNKDATILAGGMTLIPTLKQRLAKPTHLIDISRIARNGITYNGSHINIPATMTHAEVAASELVKLHIPGLAQSAHAIGDPMVRNKGTLGGAVANADPAADYPAALLALNATIETTQRRIAADEFFVDFFETALERTELITSIDFQIPEISAYEKFPQPASLYALTGVFLSRYDSAVRVGVTGAGAHAFRERDIEQALSQNYSAQAMQDLVIDFSKLNNDIHASSHYRAHLIKAMAIRAIESRFSKNKLK